MQGIIIENKSNMYHVKIDKTNEIYSCYARGKFKKNEISPVVGDRVKISDVNEKEKEAVIDEIEERKVYIRRPKLSNLTQLVFVVSSKDPKPDLLMLDKQLVYAELMNIRPIIILNKIDLEKEEEILKIERIYTNIGYQVIRTDLIKKIGIDKVREILKNNISVFSGNSGVGKSTLINSVFEKNLTEEGNISQKNKRGKNTTTVTKLYEIENNSYIADTPGFSTFEINEILSTDLDKYFKEFKNEINKCEFVGCTHIKEENCGIKKALESNKISISRYENYIKIYEDLKEKEEHKW